MNKATAKALIRRIKAVTAKLAKNRDELRDIIDEAETMIDGKDEDIMDLERVADSLSRFV